MRVPGMLCHLVERPRSFILCSTEFHGFPIMYESAGFGDLFETQPQGCTKTACGARIGVDAIRTSYPSLEPYFKEKCDLSTEEITKALDFLQARSAQEVKQMCDMGTGSFVTVDRTMGELPSLKVIAVVMHMLKIPASGRRYAVGLQAEITDITLEELLKNALHGEITESKQSKTNLQMNLDLLQNDDVLNFLHKTMNDVQSALAAETLSRRRQGHWRQPELSLLRCVRPGHDVRGISSSKHNCRLQTF